MMEVTFEPSMSTDVQCVSIAINSDGVLEEDETLIVSLTPTDEAVVINTISTTITIVNDDGTTSL